jgi:hypothetical protein
MMVEEQHTSSSDYLQAATILNNAGVALLAKTKQERSCYEAATDRMNEALMLMNRAIKRHTSKVAVVAATAAAAAAAASTATSEGRDEKVKVSPSGNEAACCNAEEKKNESRCIGLSEAETEEHVKIHDSPPTTKHCQSSLTSLTMPPPQEQEQLLQLQQQQRQQEPIRILQVPNNVDNGSLESLREIQLLASVIILNLSITNQAAAVAEHDDVIQQQQQQQQSGKSNKTATTGGIHPTSRQFSLETAGRLAKMAWSIVSQLLSTTTHAQALENPTLLILAQTTLRQVIAVQEQQQQQEEEHESSTSSVEVTTNSVVQSSSSSSKASEDTIQYYHFLHGVTHTLSMIQATRALLEQAHAGAA